MLIFSGKNIFIMSNNSTKTIKENINKLHKLGFLMVLEDHVISPDKVLAHILSKTPSDLPVYLIGSEGLQVFNFILLCMNGYKTATFML